MDLKITFKVTNFSKTGSGTMHFGEFYGGANAQMKEVGKEKSASENARHEGNKSDVVFFNHG